MNSASFKTEKTFTKKFGMVVVLLLLQSPSWAWNVDFSRRKLEFNTVTDQNALATPPTKNLLPQNLFDSQFPAQDVVILNTENGFIPAQLQLRKGTAYKIHVVNLNEKNKNISFMMEAFAQSHNTVFGQTKTFQIIPRADGVFTYFCPETSAQGKAVVLPTERTPAAAN